MSDSDAALERRLAAVERALDGEPGRSGADSDGVDDLEQRVETLESRLDELDAAVQSIRGFLGGVSAVNESVERRADAAVAAVERLERRLDEGDTPAPRDGAEPIAVLSASADTDAAAEADETDEPAERGIRERLRDLQ